MIRYAPIAMGVLLIVGLTVVQFRMTDRSLSSPLGSGTNVSAQQRADLLKKVPKVFGNWRGEDKPIDEQVKDTAGAVGAVSRVYRNIRTNEVVDLWLIVGHGRPVSRHTPDICYRSSGFGARSSKNAPYIMYLDDEQETPVPFLTNTFYREDTFQGRQLIRVFWTWYNSENKEHKGKVVWEAPDNPRWQFGNTRALYKMYFTSEMRDPMETSEQSPCLQFAKEFLPEMDKALSHVHSESTTAKAASAGQPAPDGEAAATTDADVEPELGVDTQEPAAEKAQEPAAEKADEPAKEPVESPASEDITEPPSNNEEELKSLDELLGTPSDPAAAPEPGSATDTPSP